MPDADNEIQFDIQGEGKILGVDNGDPQDHEDYKSNRRRAFIGLCLALLQSTAVSGQIRIAASSAGLLTNTRGELHRQRRAQASCVPTRIFGKHTLGLGNIGGTGGVEYRSGWAALLKKRWAR